MVADKLKSFNRALLYSYQTATVKKDELNAEPCRVLINPDKVKFDYDEKIISVDFKYNFQSGDSFEWPDKSGIHWIILKQELTELAYFRGNIRRCQLLTIEDPETKEKINLWCAVRGPVETKINSIQKANIVADVPNMTLDIYMKLTDQTVRLFNRYKRFEFMGKFWQVNTSDSISTPRILGVVAQEDYDCKHGDFVVNVEDPNPPAQVDKPSISGDTFVKPLTASSYTIINSVIESDWVIKLSAGNKKAIKDVLEYSVSSDKKTIKVTWTAVISGTYILEYGDLTKTIVVESLF